MTLGLALLGLVWAGEGVAALAPAAVAAVAVEAPSEEPAQAALAPAPPVAPVPAATEEDTVPSWGAPAAAPPQTVPERWTLPADVVATARAVKTRPIGERIEAVTRSFLGLPYQNDAAGEGEGIDPDPPARYDTFDCLTFVEEALGVALAGDPLYAPGVRDALRYRGAPAYTSRRHFMEAQWIPDGIANGLFTDITASVGRARTLTKTVTLDTWRGWRRRALFRVPDALLPVGTWSLRYLDLAEAAATASRVPPGAIVVTVRIDRPYIPVVVTHVSLAIPAEDGAGPTVPLRMRHATRMGARTVRDDRLPWYMVHLRDYVNWPSLGVAILMPREQGPRISALTAPLLPGPPLPDADGALPAFVPQPLAPADARPTHALEEAPH